MDHNQNVNVGIKGPVDQSDDDREVWTFGCDDLNYEVDGRGGRDEVNRDVRVQESDTRVTDRRSELTPYETLQSHVLNDLSKIPMDPTTSTTHPGQFQRLTLALILSYKKLSHLSSK